MPRTASVVLGVAVVLAVRNIERLPWTAVYPATSAPQRTAPAPHLQTRRASLAAAVAVAVPLLAPEVTRAEDPSKEDYAFVRSTFAALQLDPKEPGTVAALERAELDFGKAIARFEGPLLQSGPPSQKLRQNRVDRGTLHQGRAQARINLNEIAGGTRRDLVEGAVKDFDAAIQTMEENFRDFPEPIYSEYPNDFIRRGLAKEELQNWKGAVEDYDRAITLMRPTDGRADVPLRGNARPVEGDGLGMNPMVLNFRGNALSRLERYTEALADYREAADIFENDRELRQASLSRANQALALFGASRDQDAVAVLRQVVRKDPGVTDAHVALAAAYWNGLGVDKDVSRAESEWAFACNNIDTGCRNYKDLEWVAKIRRWPPPLVSSLRNFLGKGRV